MKKRRFFCVLIGILVCCHPMFAYDWHSAKAVKPTTNDYETFLDYHYHPVGLHLSSADTANKARMEQSQKILDLREKYYKEYSKFLTQKQIERAYELEQQTMRRLARHHRQSTGGMDNRRPNRRR